jgi:hypothetical protein
VQFAILEHNEEEFLQTTRFFTWNNNNFSHKREADIIKIWICFDDNELNEVKIKIDYLDKSHEKDFTNRKLNFWVPGKSFIKRNKCI